MRFVIFLVSLSSKSVKTMTNYMKTIVASLMLATGTLAMAQQVNDSNTPLHLMRPAYKIGYGVSSVEQVKQTMDRVLKYIDGETPAKLINGKTGEEVTKWNGASLIQLFWLLMRQRVMRLIVTMPITVCNCWRR